MLWYYPIIKVDYEYLMLKDIHSTVINYLLKRDGHY